MFSPTILLAALATTVLAQKPPTQAIPSLYVQNNCPNALIAVGQDGEYTRPISAINPNNRPPSYTAEGMYIGNPGPHSFLISKAVGGKLDTKNFANLTYEYENESEVFSYTLSYKGNGGSVTNMFMNTVGVPDSACKKISAKAGATSTGACKAGAANTNAFIFKVALCVNSFA